jgi:hypothetical protein
MCNAPLAHAPVSLDNMKLDALKKCYLEWSGRERKKFGVDNDAEIASDGGELLTMEM